MAFSFLKYLFFVIEIVRLLYYANEESNDVIGGSTKAVQHSIKNISRNIKAEFLHDTHLLHTAGFSNEHEQ